MANRPSADTSDTKALSVPVGADPPWACCSSLIQVRFLNYTQTLAFSVIPLDGAGGVETHQQSPSRGDSNCRTNVDQFTGSQVWTFCETGLFSKIRKRSPFVPTSIVLFFF